MSTPTIGHYHVYPVGDLRDHVVDGFDKGATCWCKPVKDETDLPVGIVVWIHNSMDQRELLETGQRLLQ